MKIDFAVDSEIKRTTRIKQLEAMFDVPPTDKLHLEWHGDVELPENWNVGLIVGPSGCGKSQILRRYFGNMIPLEWNADSVIDDFAKELSMQDISGVCQAVGFNTIPAWMRPFRVLSNGEQFRVEMARRLLENETIVIDEFTSVVDRQVAKIGAHAVQKYIRAKGKLLVAASCHYDVIDWLQPDWVFEPATMTLTGRSLQRRPELPVEVSRVHYSAWRIFAPFHYLTADLNKSAKCFSLFVDGRIAAFAGILHRPHPKSDDIKGVSRLVTLPDWQGLGLAMALVDKLGAAYAAINYRLRTYPAHPALIRSFGKSPNWGMVKKPGHFSPRTSTSTTLGKAWSGQNGELKGAFGNRPCAVFEYRGEKMDVESARGLIYE